MLKQLRQMVIFLLVTVFTVFQIPQAQQLAFPGAEGFGRFTKGGRGGRIIEVTNLNDAGPGSLREALGFNGARIIVFRVSGAITLASDIQINYPFVTVAGQTAPGGGIAIHGGGLFFRTGEVIIRFVRIRVGKPASDSNTGALWIWSPDPAYHNNDNTLWSENAMIDHVSSSWASDDNLSTWGRVRNVTVQWSLISESMGAMLIHPAQQGLSVHHNLMATCQRRYPCGGGKVDVVNNVMYNFPSKPTLIQGWQYQFSRPAYGNIVNNFYKEGPWTLSHGCYWGANPEEIEMLYVCNNGMYPNSCNASDSTEIYVNGNLLRKHQSAANEPARIVNENQNQNTTNGTLTQISARHPFPTVATTSAEQAYTDVLAKAGAFPRDAIDARVVDQVQKQTSIYPYMWHTYNGCSNWSFSSWDPKANVGWPIPAAGTPPVDTDRDGMPDSWETANGLNPNLPADGSLDKDSDGYTNVEEYLNELAGNNSNTAIGSVKPSSASKSIVSRKAKQCPLDIFGRTLSERGGAQKAFTNKIVERKLDSGK